MYKIGIMRIGLFGGCFDPPHIGHLLVAQQALEHLVLDHVLFIPAKSPPHKFTVAEAKSRYEMVLLATADNSNFFASNLELKRLGNSYSFDTLAEIHKLHTKADIFLIMGVDAYADIDSWYRAKEVVDKSQVVVYPRLGYNLKDLNPYFKERVLFLDAPTINISSTDIRKRLGSKRPIYYLVPKLVECYLAKHQLYQMESRGNPPLAQA